MKFQYKPSEHGFPWQLLWQEGLVQPLYFIIACAAISGAEKSQAQSEPSRVLPEKSTFVSFRSSTFGFGIYSEVLQYRTAKNYKATGLGVSLGYDQVVHGIWSGGLHLRWSDWVPTEEGKLAQFNPVSPLTLFSRIEAAPRLTPWLGETLGTVVRPFGVAGVGILTFLSYRGFPPRRAEREHTETAITMGAGVRIVLPRTFALRLGIERWRGLRSFSYSAMTYQCELQFGDVDAR